MTYIGNLLRFRPYCHHSHPHHCRDSRMEYTFHYHTRTHSSDMLSFESEETITNMPNTSGTKYNSFRTKDTHIYLFMNVKL